ncbi:hypothetical protein HKD37_04G009013 [Glycine soja]
MKQFNVKLSYFRLTKFKTNLLDGNLPSLSEISLLIPHRMVYSKEMMIRRVMAHGSIMHNSDWNVNLMKQISISGLCNNLGGARIMQGRSTTLKISEDECSVEVAEIWFQ